MSLSSCDGQKEEDMQSRPESPPLGPLDPSRIQNPLAEQQLQNPDAFLMPEPRQQHWQRTPTMSPATNFPPNAAGSAGTPGSQRSSTGTPTQFIGGSQPGQMQVSQQSPFPHASPQGQPMTPGTPGNAQHQQQQQFEFHQAQLRQQQQQQQQQQQTQQGQPIQYPNDSSNMYRPMPGHMGPQQLPLQHPHHAPQYAPNAGYPPQWQQQMYVRPGPPQQRPQMVGPPQRVPVPYPGGAYAPPGQVYPTQAGQRSAPVSAPNSGGPQQQQPQPQPQQQPPPTAQQQRPQYPQGTAQAPPYPYPAGQVTPTGQPYPPPGAFPSPVHQIYRGPTQNAQNIRQYISPQGVAPQTSRFPGQPHAVSSPHFAAAAQPDLRSPVLMSPTQAPPNQGLPRAIVNADMAQVAAMRQMAMMPPPAAPQAVLPPQMQYRTHDPNAFPTVSANPELFLTGCMFYVFESDRLFSDKLDVHNLVFAIKFYGGDIEMNPKSYPEKMHSVTHVITDSCRSLVMKAPIEQGKRLVTLQWLMDVFHRQKMEVPWKLSHLPGPFGDAFRPYQGKLFSLAGFDEDERASIQFMAESMGGKISPFLSRFNDLLIAKIPCEKVEKAREWNIPVVNYQWIADAYIPNNSERPALENPRYQLGHATIEVNQSPNIIEIMSPEFRQLLAAWKHHIVLTEELIVKAQENRQKMLNDETNFPMNRFLNQEPAPTDEQLAEAKTRNVEKQRKYDEYVKKMKEEEEVKNIVQPPMKVVVCFGPGFSDDLLVTLVKKLAFLGGKTCDDVKDCTHLVLINGRRCMKLLEGICLGKNIMSPDWIVDGYKNGMFMDTLDYFLRDEDTERQLGYSCRRSILRARHCLIFEDVEFYVTPSVQPNVETINKLILLAGGKLIKQKPSARYLAKCIENDQPVLIISCEVDVRSLSYLSECNFPIYNTDLVLMSILRQNIQLHAMYRVPGMFRHFPQIIRPQPPPYAPRGLLPIQ